MDNRALILVDYSNWHYYLKDQGWRIDWQKFANYWRQEYSEVNIYYFEGIISFPYFEWRQRKKPDLDFGEAKKKKNKIFKWIKSCGIKVKTKPINVVYDNTSGRTIPKCNFDVEITIQALTQLADYDVLILCSGDGDFVKLAKYVKGQHKTLVVVAPPDRINDKLRKTAHDFKSVASFREHFELDDDDTEHRNSR